MRLNVMLCDTDVNQIVHQIFKPTTRGFNGTLRSECLDGHWFATLAEAKEVIEAWRREYNESRPHGALGEKRPHEIACEFADNREFTNTKTVEDSLSE